jgi:hypothetical protein
VISCPKCGHRFAVPKAKRVCVKCKQPIGYRHKWYVNLNSQVCHRNCKNPTEYH